MTITDLVAPEAILPALKVNNKKQALQELAARAASLTGQNERAVFEVLLQREKLGTTAVGYGLRQTMALVQPFSSAFRSTTKKDPMQEPQESDVLIAIVDDDPSARQGLQRLVRSVGWKAETFASAQEFLAHARIEPPSCVVLDLQLPGLSGLDLQKRMAEAGLETPIVFLTGHGNIPASVQAIKAGAVEFLTKPFDEQDLLRAIQEAIERDRRTRKRHADMRDLRERYESLTPREQEIILQVVSGLLNKQIAADLKITEDTVKFHRGHIMRKMRADSLADLVRMAESLGIRSNQRSEL